MDASQVIIRPVVSEKSYVLATADRYTFRGYTSGRTRAWKKAIVQVQPGQSIPIFQGLEADL